MKIISSRIHGMLDYGMGILVAVIPWLLGFARGGAETWIPVVLGIGVIAYSLFTDYELGAVRVIPLRVHLIIDAVGGLFLAASPWLFGFADFIWMPHVVLGLAELAAATMTRTTPDMAIGRKAGTLT